MRASIGHSDDPDTLDAITAVIEQIEEKLCGDTPKAALLFCSVDYEHELLLESIQRKWPGLPLTGASSDGEISSTLGFCDDSILLTVFSGDDIRVYAGLGENLSQDIDAAVAQATAGFAGAAPRACVTTFAPSTDATQVLRSLSTALGDAECPVLGGLSGDHREFARTREFFGAGVHTDSLPLLLIEGDLEVSWGIGSGWFPTGDEMTITRAVSNVVYEINGLPAVDVYTERYGEVPSEFLGEFPLACRDDDGNWPLRATLQRDDSEGSLTFAGSVPQGSIVRFTEVLDEGLLSGSEGALVAALDAFKGESPELALVFSCAARKWVLGSEVSKEIEVLKAVAEDRGLIDLAMAGLYCFGEIAPNGTEPRNGFHNETCVSVVLGR